MADGRTSRGADGMFPAVAECDKIGIMTKLEKIEQEVAQLGPDDIRAFAEWFARFQADLRDRQIERDANEGRLDAFAEQALADFRSGRAAPL